MARISKNQLIKLQKKYRTDQAIANLYGLTRQEVHRLRKMYGIAPVGQKHVSRNQEIVQSLRKGVSASRLSEKYNLSAAHIYRIARAAGER